MKLANWSEEYCIGEDELDSQHKRMFELVNELNDAMVSGHSQEALASIMAQLIAYTQTHFAYEEQVMLNNDYINYIEHKKMHDALAGYALEIKRQIDEGNMCIDISLMNFLLEWVENHVKNEDKKIGIFLEEKRKLS